MFVRFTLRQLIKSLAIWALQLARILSPRQRFLALSPPVLRQQVLFDCKSWTFQTVQIRSWIDWTTLYQIYFKNDYGVEKLARAAELQSRYQVIVARGAKPLILDCGANIGLSARFFADTYPQALIICIEPDAGNAAQARINTSGKSVTVLEAAIGSTDARGRIVDATTDNNAFQITPDANGPVSIVALSTLLKEYAVGGVEPFIVKIDIEGFERDLFSRHTDWIDRFPLLIIELHDWMLPGSASARPFLQAIAARNRDFIYHGENVFSIANPVQPAP